MLNDEQKRMAIEGYLDNRLGFSVAETARILGRSTKWARDMAKTGALPTVLLGGKLIVVRPVIIEMLTRGL